MTTKSTKWSINVVVVFYFSSLISNKLSKNILLFVGGKGQMRYKEKRRYFCPEIKHYKKVKIAVGLSEKFNFNLEFVTYTKYLFNFKFALLAIATQ